MEHNADASQDAFSVATNSKQKQTNRNRQFLATFRRQLNAKHKKKSPIFANSRLTLVFGLWTLDFGLLRCASETEAGEEGYTCTSYAMLCYTTGYKRLDTEEQNNNQMVKLPEKRQERY